MNAAPRDFSRMQMTALGFSGSSVARGQNRLASAQVLAHLFDNTRAVPLARKRDAHQGRVFLCPHGRGALTRPSAEFGQKIAVEASQVHILDDVLVNTDTVRQERILDVLGAQAERLQILILTCHPDRYRGVGTPIALVTA